MDSPVPEGIKIHYAGDFSLMGRLAEIPDYKSGDIVQYGGMLYRPNGPNGEMIFTAGDYGSGGGNGWGGESGVKQHKANMWQHESGRWTFFCS